MDRWDVQQKQSGQSLQLFLKEKLTNASGKQIKRLIDSGRCLLNGKPERFSSRLVGAGDIVELDHSSSIPKAVTVDKNAILFLDEYLIVYNKPAGIASDDPDLLKHLKKQFGEVILLHRLDKETTGILLFARNEQTAKAIEGLFKKRLVKKMYLAIVDGVPKKNLGIIENHLGKLSVYQGQTIWGEVPQGLYAKTNWKFQKSGNGASMLCCQPETGRTHQIRVHLSAIGHPILGDHQYGRAAKCKYRPQRTLLHASSISFEHPFTKKMFHIDSPMPHDFIEAMRTLWGTDG